MLFVEVLLPFILPVIFDSQSCGFFRIRVFVNVLWLVNVDPFKVWFACGDSNLFIAGDITGSKVLLILFTDSTCVATIKFCLVLDIFFYNF